MKKLLSLALAFIMLATLLTACDSSHTQTPETPEPETTAPHIHTFVNATCQAPKTCTTCGVTEGEKLSQHDTTDGKCSMCGLDYFDELFKLINDSSFYSENTKEENAKTYGVSCNVNDNLNKYDYIIDIENDNVLRLCCYRFVPGLFKYDNVPYQTLIVYITKSSIRKQIYDYRAIEQDVYTIWKSIEIEGEIEATDFSASRVLDYEEYDGGSKSDAEGVAVYASQLLRDAITEMIIPLLEENGLTISNYGFELFE